MTNLAEFTKEDLGLDLRQKFIMETIAAVKTEIERERLELYRIKLLLCTKRVITAFAIMNGETKIAFLEALGITTSVSEEFSNTLLYMVAASLRQSWNKDGATDFLDRFFQIHFAFSEGFDTWAGRLNVSADNMDFLDKYLSEFAISDVIDENWCSFIMSCYSNNQLMKLM